MWLYVTVLFGDPVDLTQLKLQLETAVTSKKLKEMIYKIKNIVAKRGNLPNGEPLWGRDVEAISSKLYNLCRAERLQWSGSPESARFKLSNITRELRLIFASRPIPERDFKTEVRFYYGRPGSGKSRRAQQEAQATGGRIYYKPRGDWWDGYKQHECVIIDDFYGWIKYDDLLKICDRYPYQVPVKGSFEQFTSKYIWITSNVGLESIYRFIGYDCTAIKRRCEIIEEIN